MPSDFWWKKKFASLTNNFWSFKKRIKNFHQQNLYFFHQKSEGIAFIFCRYLYQNMRAFIFCRYCPPIVFCPQIWKTKKSSKIEGNTLGILRRSFFPFTALGMPSFNNSVPFRTFRHPLFPLLSFLPLLTTKQFKLNAPKGSIRDTHRW